MGTIEYISGIDWLLGLFYFAMVIFGAYIYKKIYIKSDDIYTWFIPGLIIKMLGGIAALSIYAYYYGGGDLFAYWHNTKPLINLFFEDPFSTMRMVLGENSNELYSYFNSQTGVPHYYMFTDPNAWSVSRFSFPFAFLGLNSVISTTILLNVFLFIGPWKLAKILVNEYPEHKSAIIISMLMIPSCVFWGSGIMKDSFTFSATLWLFASAISVFRQQKQIIINVILIILNSYIIISIKPYIFISVLPAILILSSLSLVHRIKNKLVKYTVFPSIIVFIFSAGLLIFIALSDNLGVYGSVDDALNKMAVSQQDFTENVTYGKNYFDIGKFDPTFTGILSKVHLAWLYGFFGPFIWQATNPVMLISALETFILAILFIKFLLLMRFKRNRKLLTHDNIVFAFLIFSLIFVMFVGVSTANYGALVRYRIPAFPFFLFVLLYLGSRKHKENKQMN